jgi:hypothetical protein
MIINPSINNTNGSSKMAIITTNELITTGHQKEIA